MLLNSSPKCFSVSSVVLTVYFFLAVTIGAQTAPASYALIPDNPRPGEPVTIGVRNGAGAKSAVLMVEGKRLTRAAFFSVSAENDSDGGKQSFMAAVLTVPATVKPGSRAVIAVEAAGGIIREITVAIAGREFISEVIELNPTLTGIRTEPDPRKTAEADHLWSILNRTGADSYHFGAFSPPVSSTRRTSFFGDRRVYQYSNGNNDISIHAGIDYGVPKGTAVNACGQGKVVLARNRIVTGNSVIIEHLPGVYSLYYHLDTIEVAEGALVNAGALLGLSGATGLATGPHLHWEIRVSGENTDPDAFIARPILDKEAILDKIYP
ncbi:MAG: M23 family metallopeptidase [Treponema sp.]|jgi:murein DD-endopeptidase MepM/ murein hydrolase activator NlpD|nr:M23 family metallopeptidase [Treponema sp.]